MNPCLSLKRSCTECRDSNEKYYDYAQRAQRLRAVVLGSVEGLVFTTTLILSEGMRFMHQTRDVGRAHFIRVIAGALAMATSEFVSVHTQIDIVKAQHDRDVSLRRVGALVRLPPPDATQIAVAASTAYALGGTVPLVLAWALRDCLRDQTVVFSVAAISASGYLFVMANIVAYIGRASLVRSFLRVILAGWIEIGIMLGKWKLISSLTN